jgi:hypothetical protein
MKTIQIKSANISEHPGSAVGSDPCVMTPPDPEVPAHLVRRKFTAKYKLCILEEADACTEPGQMGALLRREGLYSSHLTTWRRQRKKGILQGISPKKRGRKSKEKNSLAKRVAQLEKENRQLQHRLRQAETIIEAQKKISELLGITQSLDESERNNS